MRPWLKIHLQGGQHVIIMAPMVIFHTEGQVRGESKPLPHKPSEVFGLVTKREPQVSAGGPQLPSFGQIGQHAERRSSADAIIVFVRFTRIGFDLTHRIENLTANEVRFNCSAKAAVEVAVGAKLAASKRNRVHTDAQIPGGCPKE